MKKIFCSILLFLMIFIGLNGVKAALPNSIGPITQKDELEDSLGYAMHLKVGSGYAAICTDYYKSSPAGSDDVCTKTSDWGPRIRYSVAAVISAAKPNVNTTNITSQYFAAEMAINVFLKQKGVGASSLDGHNLKDGYSSNGTYYNAYATYLNLANTAYNDYPTASKVAISLSSSALTFTLSGSNYVSNNITVSGVDDYTVNTSLGSVTKSGKTFKVTVPANKVSSDTTITVTVKSSKTLNQARNYNCGSGYQSVTPVALETKTFSDEKSVSGTIAPRGSLIINKYDVNNQHLKGATIKVTGPDYSKEFTTTGAAITLSNLKYGTYTITETKAPSGYIKATAQTITLSSSSMTGTVNIKNTKNKIVISKVDITGVSELPGATLEIQDSQGKTIHKWVSTNTPKTIEGLPVGKYYLIETIAPEGYILSKEKIEFEITEATTTKNLKMTNSLNSIKILKIDSVSKKALPGATLELQDEKGNVVKYCTDKDGNKNTECKWVTTTESYEIKGLPKGTYYLVETKAPDSYVLNKEKVKIIVSEATVEDSYQMENELNKVIISKLSALTKKELPGATLELQDEKGNIVKYCTDEKGNKNTACKWVSTNKPYEIEGLPNGTYYIVETIAPKGYVLNREKVKFIVDGSKATYEVEMTNEPEVEVPDTLSSKSALLVAMAMSLIALGIGLITYIKKYKLN